ncbi:MAG: hypothetical protein B7O98_00955 [Zestosphaera tikiterensis]|uniref:DUF998 domain-containing protein n=1 Tax=Zestosphaera tikiterensis TaxID=1973259 RepID=A0A2R7Y9A8_9CREN|nr:MAG: hypothetical protein B7O98_00955 [Zestosphaera tikiterensis]
MHKLSRCNVWLMLSLAAIAIPLLFIALAALLSGWFNIYNNALSDLGHAVRSNVALIFNLGLSLGGLLLVITSIGCIFRRYRVLSYVGVLVGYSLTLVAVFDEVYGRLHFIVSVAFFLSLAIMLITYMAVFKKVTPIPSLVVSVLAWYAHLTYRIPRGAAIPELISIFATMPFYIDVVLRSLKPCDEQQG